MQKDTCRNRKREKCEVLQDVTKDLSLVGCDTVQFGRSVLVFQTMVLSASSRNTMPRNFFTIARISTPPYP